MESPPHRFSRPACSTAPAPLRTAEGQSMMLFCFGSHYREGNPMKQGVSPGHCRQAKHVRRARKTREDERLSLSRFWFRFDIIGRDTDRSRYLPVGFLPCFRIARIDKDHRLSRQNASVHLFWRNSVGSHNAPPALTTFSSEIGCTCVGPLLRRNCGAVIRTYIGFILEMRRVV